MSQLMAPDTYAIMHIQVLRGPVIPVASFATRDGLELVAETVLSIE